jgi:hypothetical protein
MRAHPFFVIPSEARNLLFRPGRNPKQIPRFARNDKKGMNVGS